MSITIRQRTFESAVNFQYHERSNNYTFNGKAQRYVHVVGNGMGVSSEVMTMFNRKSSLFKFNCVCLLILLLLLWGYNGNPSNWRVCAINGNTMYPDVCVFRKLLMPIPKWWTNCYTSRQTTSSITLTLIENGLNCNDTTFNFNCATSHDVSRKSE